MLPVTSTATSLALSSLEPPRNDEYANAAPVGLRIATKPSAPSPKEPPLYDVSKAPEVTGKSAEFVTPATTTLPAGSSFTAIIESDPLPPRNVAQISALPFAVTLATKPSPGPASSVSNAPRVAGKSA